jgi:DNA-binding beta-propeller fold protein YncE
MPVPIPLPAAQAVTLMPIRGLFEITHTLRAPTDVAVSEDGRIYVVDGVHHKIKIFSKNGEFLSSLGGRGSKNGEFSSPLGITVDNLGSVYIADSGNHRVQIFNRQGHFVRDIDIPAGNLHLADPTDVALDAPRNRFYVVDNDNHRILVYHLKTFELMGTFGKPGTQRREFRYPFLLAVNADGYLHVVDVLNTRVQVLSSEGFFVSVIGQWGVEKGEFFRPKGVAIDAAGRVYVSDSYMGVIQVFDPNGDFRAVIGNPTGQTVKKFKTPTGIYIDRRNRLYVVETFADKVSVFSLEAGRE